MHSTVRPVVVSTSALLLESTLVLVHAPAVLVLAIALTGPFLVSWLAFSIFMDRSRSPRRLDDDEWGYVDRTDVEPDSFHMHPPHSPA